MANEAWTPAVLNKVKTLLTRGLSTAEIGKKIGMSKNAVVGKLNRLGWNAKSFDAPVKKPSAGKSAPVKAKPAPKKPAAKTKVIAKAPVIKKKPTPPATKAKALKPAPKKAAEKPAAMPKASVKSNSKTLAMHQRIIQHSLEMAALKPDQCRWPIGDPDSEKFHFCGAPVFVGKPYCYEHCKMAYQFQPPKKKS
ncbi:MAG: GcrA family cell cycle regulator [Alphaproteobacteria bacterium]|nr:GcrA family cell cycle regulator [Alphaproteobacteria bacterium]